jgi:hypothetical protein
LSAVWSRASTSDSLIGFYREHSLDLFEEPLWTLPWCVLAVSGAYTSVRSENPLRVEIRFSLEGGGDVGRDYRWGTPGRRHRASAGRVLRGGPDLNPRR